ncbi:hypothetical protein VHEMI00066 [[Torrubiella] hemipterigena]|uniref:Concanavalin A-like lectin/glucanase n=1 Tax=[Torrubiella] hemipterigena TaxID=1531966 RepID=A0A0A1SPC6_9HYPO|nr:hypothetical protein VHEMI00066 [[Torrubiella] hemipterigena]
MKYATILTALAASVSAAPSVSERDADAALVPDFPRAYYHSKDSSNSGSDNWAGVVRTANVSFAHATMIMPLIVPGRNAPTAAVSAWVGIDGSQCGRALLQTGVDILANGKFSPWAEWYPDDLIEFQGFDISAGDKIGFTVIAHSPTSGTCILDNYTTNKQVKREFTQGPTRLCLMEADWILEEYDENGRKVPLLDFGMLAFHNVMADGHSGHVTAAGGEIIDLVTEDRRSKTKCEILKGDVECTAILPI